ncbi:MAG: ABC transporter substrate-binding protein [Proteobacteria bacterium]|nr:ABC transporter substrate-binding protein [Pseudomonadota bacterium]
MRRFPVVLLALLLAAFVLAPVALAREEVRVGVLLPLSGLRKAYGEVQKRACEMAADEINGAGGVGGRVLSLVFGDSGGGPEAARAAVEKLVGRDRALILVGGYEDETALEEARAAQELRVPFLVTTARDDRITSQGWEYVFRLASPVSATLDSLESFLREQGGVETAAVLYEETPENEAEAGLFEALAGRMGIRLVLKEGWESPGNEFAGMLVRVKAKNPDMVYVAASVRDATFFMRKARDLNVDTRLYAGNTTGFTSNNFKLNARAATSHIYSLSPWVPTLPYAGAEDFFKKFAMKYLMAPIFQAAQAYAAIQVAAGALEKSREAVPAAVRDALAGTDRMTVFGPVKFESFLGMTRQNRPTGCLVQWLDGNLEAVWPKDFSTAEFVYPVPSWKEQEAARKQKEAEEKKW